MTRPGFLTALVAAFILTACGGSGNVTVNSGKSGPVYVVVPVGKTAGTAPYLTARLTALREGGTIRTVYVSFTPRAQRPRKTTIVLQGDPAMALRVARSFGGPLDNRAVATLAQQVVRSTYCRSGPVEVMGGRTRYSKPEDLQAIAEHIERTGRDGIPPGLKGEKLPPVWRDPNVANRINVDMRCNAPDPYR